MSKIPTELDGSYPLFVIIAPHEHKELLLDFIRMARATSRFQKFDP
jgi:hypothetical protein